jgi:hypothetical protein
MPFANLPVSGFQAPQAPDWTRFAAQANEFIARQPHPDTASAVTDAANQINEILKLSSPEGRLERQVHRLELEAKMKLYEDYKLHPESYQVTSRGIIHNDPQKFLKDAFDIKEKAERIKNLYLRNKGLENPPSQSLGPGWYLNQAGASLGAGVSPEVEASEQSQDNTDLAGQSPDIGSTLPPGEEEGTEGT